MLVKLNWHDDKDYKEVTFIDPDNNTYHVYTTRKVTAEVVRKEFIEASLHRLIHGDVREIEKSDLDCMFESIHFANFIVHNVL